MVLLAMVDETPPPLPPGPAVGDRVMIEGEIRQVGEEGHLVRFESGYGLLQYVWVKFKHVFR